MDQPIEISLDELSEMVAGGAVEHRPQRGQTRLWELPDDRWIIQRAGDDGALLFSQSWCDTLADGGEQDNDPSVAAARAWADQREGESRAVGRLGASESRFQRQPVTDIDEMISERYKPLRPAVVPHATAAAWDEIISGVMSAGEDEEVDTDQAILDLLNLGFPERLVSLIDWTRSMRIS